MAFEALSISAGRGAPLKRRVGATVLDNGQVRFVISTSLLENSRIGNRCSVLIGRDEHQGKVCFAPPADGGTHFCKPISKTQSRVMILAKRLGVSKDAQSIVTLPHEITADGLVIDVRPLMKPVAIQSAA